MIFSRPLKTSGDTTQETVLQAGWWDLDSAYLNYLFVCVELWGRLGLGWSEPPLR